jgi:hypothetical protein
VWGEGWDGGRRLGEEKEERERERDKEERENVSKAF